MKKKIISKKSKKNGKREHSQNVIHTSRRVRRGSIRRRFLIRRIRRERRRRRGIRRRRRFLRAGFLEGPEPSPAGAFFGGHVTNFSDLSMFSNERA